MAEPIATSTIAAQAFRLMELGPISSFADDTPQAQDAAQQYPMARKLCLEACDWSFASRIADLPEAVRPDTTPIASGFPYLYRLPADCLKVREVIDPCLDWRLDGDFLRADRAGPMSIRYTADQSNETRFPAMFAEAVSWRLAAMLAPRWVGATNKSQLLEQGAEQSLKQAMRADARQASAARYDGQPDRGDWVSEVLR
ncbi:hypothetical protein SAMN04244548_03003 [Paracoccus pantotrophus]|nr:hypothetical protein SAMN04244548_03003 [Paracoccus pantotrophus]